MPHKKDLSSMMSDKQFFAMWELHKPVIYYMIKKYARKYPIHTIPGHGDIEDTAGIVMLELRRLGIFARFNSNRTSSHMGHYVGAQVLSTLSHLWDDHCRTNKRFRESLSTTSLSDEEVASKTTNSLENSKFRDAIDPCFQGWSAFGANSGAADDFYAPADTKAIHNDILDKTKAKTKPLSKHAAPAIDAIRKGLSAPTASALSTAMGISPATARATLKTISATLATVIAEAEATI